jgi:phage-related minor tail protein
MAKEGTIKIRLTGDSSEAEAAIENVGTSAGKLESIFQGVGQHLGSALTDGLGVITDQIGAAMDIGAGKDKLQAQLGLSAEDADRYGKIAGDLYKGAWGDSLDDVNNTLALITQNIGEGNDEWLKSTAALTTDFAATFGQDAEGITSAIATMLNTGIAQSSEEAFDILTKGMQSGANKADDLLDTFTEYPTLFRELGLNGTEAMGLISQSLQAGARDSDFVADALKEFSLRAKNGSETTAEGFKATGLGWPWTLR